LGLRTANFYEPQTALQLIDGIRQFMQRGGIQDVREIIGSVGGATSGRGAAI
jgi:hypothetical protein